MIRLLTDCPQISLNGMWNYRIEDRETSPLSDRTGADQPGSTSPGGRASSWPDTDSTGWRDMTIPTNWYLTEVGDYFGAIWFRTSFALPAAYTGKRIFLRFGAVDYYADVWLNGLFLGSHEGMFNPFEFDITNCVKIGADNQLMVRDDAPRAHAVYKRSSDSENPLSPDYKSHQAVDIDLIKGHMIDAMHKPGSMTKFRGDGNTGGIWDDVSVIAREPVFIEYAKIFTRIVKKKDWTGDKTDKVDGTGLVTADIRINNTTGDVIETEIEMSIAPYNFDASGPKNHLATDAATGGSEGDVGACSRRRAVVLQPGINTFKLVVTIDQARLWWTWDHGFPNLYSATFRIGEDTLRQNFGIKEVVHDEKTGRWSLNGKPVFLRGMRYISGNWMSVANESMWRDDLAKMRDMNINAIRIGSHVEKDGFYTMCDEMGFLLWQVFPLHYCVSDSEDFIERASEMIRDMGEMIYNHACLGMWSTFKEPEIYQFVDKPNNYFRLCEILKETLGTIDPTRWIHKGDYREGVLNLMIGCCWDGDTDMKKVTFQPNIVEFGAASIPCLETLKTFIPEDKLWPPHWDTWEYWGLFYDLTFKFAKIKMGDSLQAFIDNTQTYEAKVVKEQIEIIRQHKYAPVGSMFLYYWSDACPMIGSGLLDYYRRPYKVYDSMKAVYTPVLISLEWNADPYIIGRDKIYQPATDFVGRVWVNNDREMLSDCRIEWKIVKSDTSETMLANAFVSSLAPDSAVVIDHIIWHIPVDASGSYQVQMNVSDATSVLSTNSTEILVQS